MTKLNSIKLYALKNKYELTIIGFLIIKMSWPFVGKDEAFSMSFRFCVAVVLLIFIAWISGRIIKDSGEKTRNIVLIFFALFFVSYAANSVFFLDLWYKDYFIVKNTLVIILTLIAIIFIDKPEIKWQVPVLCFLCTCIEPLYLLAFMPMMVIILIFNYISNKTASGNKALFVVSLIASVVAFLFFGIKKTFNFNLNIVSLLSAGWKLYALNVAIVLPLIILFLTIWINTLKISKDKTFNKVILLIIILPFSSVFSLFTIDKRVNLLMIATFVQFCLIFYFIYQKNSSVLLSVEKTGQFFKNNLLLVLLMVIYLACFFGFAKGFGKLYGLYGLWL